MKLLIGHKYSLYRAYTLPTFTEAQREYIAGNVARYIYLKYTSTTSDLIPRYLAVDDVAVSVNSQWFTQEGLEVSYLTIDHSVTQMVAFLRKDNRVTVLVDLPLPLFLVQMLEGLDLETPLVLQHIAITNEKIHAVVNSLDSLLRLDPSLFGEVNITFVPREKLTDDSLREIIVTVPRKDLARIVKNSSVAPYDAVLEWVSKTTTLNLRNMDTKSLECDLIAMAAKGRILFKSKGNLLDTTLGTLFADACGAL